MSGNSRAAKEEAGIHRGGVVSEDCPKVGSSEYYSAGKEGV